MRAVSLTSFTRNFGQYRDLAQSEPVAVTARGKAVGVFVSAADYAELQRLKAFERRSREMVAILRQEIGPLPGDPADGTAASVA